MSPPILPVRAMIRIGVDTNGCICEWNGGAESTSGYARQEVLGLDFVHDLLPEEVHDWVAVTLCQSWMGQLVPDIQLPLCTKSGERVELLLAVTLAWSDAKKAHNVVLSGGLAGGRGDDREAVADLVKEKAIFQSLSSSEASETDRTITIGLDHNGHVCDWSEGAKAVTGFDSNEALGVHFVDELLVQDCKCTVAESICYAWMGERVRGFRALVRTKSGRQAHMHLSPALRWEAAKGCHDVLLTGWPDTSHSIRVDKEGCITDWGDEVCAMTGLSTNEVLGLRLVDDLVTPAIRQPVGWKLEQVLAGVSVLELALPILAKNGVGQSFRAKVDPSGGAAGATLTLARLAGA